MPVIHRKTLAVWPFRANIENLKQRLSITDVLLGKTFWGLKSGAWGPRTGTMVNVGAQAITPTTSAVTITQGYHNGSGSVATDANLAAGNIKSGTTIFGVAGTLLSAQVPRTGQTATLPYPSQPTGSDGDLKKGVAWPEPRFTASNGTVRDNLTGLIWLQNADYNSTTSTTGAATWANALIFCNTLKHGYCGLNDGSEIGAWRLPNYFELVSLLDLAYANPALSNDAGTSHYLLGATSSFTGVHSLSTNLYWSSTTRATGGDANAWCMELYYGLPSISGKTYTGGLCVARPWRTIMMI